jgi:hypothetical protein
MILELLVVRKSTAGVEVVPTEGFVYLAQAKLKEFLRQGKPKSTPAYEGVVMGLKIRDIDHLTSYKVNEGTKMFGNPQKEYARTLVTYGIYTCVAIVAHNPQIKTGFIGHATCTANALHLLEELKKEIGDINKTNLVLYGGDKNDRWSVEMTSAIEGCISSEFKGITIIGKDTLRGRNERMAKIPAQSPKPDWSHSNFFSAIGLDTQTGEIFIPSSKP